MLNCVRRIQRAPAFKINIPTGEDAVSTNLVCLDFMREFPRSPELGRHDARVDSLCVRFEVLARRRRLLRVLQRYFTRPTVRQFEQGR